MADISLTKPPNAPQKKQEKREFSNLEKARRLLFQPSPPPAPKKTGRRKKPNLEPIPLEWGVSPCLIEAQFYAESGDVREKFLRNSPEDVAEMTDIPTLEKLWELYFPFSQPRNAMEEGYLALMRDCIDARLHELS